MPVVSKQAAKPSIGNGRKVSILDSIKPVDQLPTTGLKFLIFGLSGTGKTTLACSFPKPLLFVRPEQVEDGSLSIRTVKGIEAPRQLESPDELDELVAVQENSGRWNTIVLDGVSKFQDIVLKKVLSLSEVPAQLSWGIAKQSDWGIVSNEFKEHIRKLLRLTNKGCNVVILGGERSLGDDPEKNPLAAPTVMIALQPSSMGWMHEVCDYNVHTFVRRGQKKIVSKVPGKETTVTRFEPGEIEFCCHIGTNELYQTKFRKPKHVKLPEEVVNLDYDKIAKLIRGDTAGASEKPTLSVKP